MSLAPPAPDTDARVEEDRPIRLGFLMDQIAGHITNYRNLRSVAQHDDAIRAEWHELHYEIDGGLFERVRHRVPVVPEYVTGVARGTLELNRGLRDHRFEAIFTNASVAPLQRRALGRVPWMYDFDSTPVQRDEMDAYTHWHDPKPLARLKWKLSRALFHSATLLQAWSNWAKQSVVDDYEVAPDKVVVNPPGVDLDFWHPRPNAREAGGPLKVLFVGGDFARKGGRVLLDWYRAQDPARLELHVVTREPVAPRPGVVVHTGMEPNSPALRELYHQCDLFVLPSLGECFGIATVEAMAAGLPVIVTNMGGTADIVEPGRNGYLVPPNDVGALAAAIDAIAGDDARRSWMGSQARCIAETRFDVQANARRTLDALKQMARDRR